MAPRKAPALSLFFFAADASDDREGKYRLLIESAKLADSEGLQAVWTPERHFHAFGGPYPNPAVTSAALSMVTKRIHLRAGSVVLPLHDVLRVAEAWSNWDTVGLLQQIGASPAPGGIAEKIGVRFQRVAVAVDKALH